MASQQTLIIGALLVSLVAVETAVGQVDIPSPSFRHKAVESANSTRPLATPGVFGWDTQMWTPLEFTNGKEKEPGTGFFVTLDKTYTSIQKAGQINAIGENQSTGSTFITGNRYEVGWFSDDDNGWALSYQEASGIYFNAGQDVTVTNPMLVDSQFAVVEVNRMFRQTLSSGGYFEPYMGIRYSNYNDETIEDTTQTVGLATLFNRFKQEVSNNAFGFQAGGRYNVRRGRWRMTGDAAVATMYNQQRFFATDITTAGSAIQPPPQAISETYQSDQSFIPVIDGQYEIAYNISRDISLRTGVQVMYNWNGVARANAQTTTLNPNSTFSAVGVSADNTGFFDESFLSAGFLFGIEWRR